MFALIVQRILKIKKNVGRSKKTLKTRFCGKIKEIVYKCLTVDLPIGLFTLPALCAVYRPTWSRIENR